MVAFLPFLSAVLLLLSYVPFKLGFFIFLAYVPFFIYNFKVNSGKQAFWGSFITGLLFNFFQLRWLLNLEVEPRIQKLYYLGFAILCIYEALYFSVIGWFSNFLYKRKKSLLFLVPILWLVLEFIRSKGALGFPWASVYLPLLYVYPAVYWLRVIGPFGVGFLIVLFNLLIATKRLKEFIFAVFLLIILFAGGILFKRNFVKIKKLAEIKVSILQPNVLADSSDYLVNWEITEQGFSPLIDSIANQKPFDLVVLSESAIPDYLEFSDAATDFIRRFSELDTKYILLGSGAKAIYNGYLWPQNTAFLVDTSARVIDRYDKVHLVPFGEWLPYEDKFPFLRKLDLGQGDLLPGRELKPIKMDSFLLGVLICFESMFPELSRGLVRKGAEVLINITNDGWYGKSLGPVEHFEYMRARAIENYRYVIRSGKTGISAIISPDGKVLKFLDQRKRGAIVYRVPLLQGKTLYDKYGDTTVVLVVIFTGLIFFGISEKKEQQGEEG